MLDIQFVRNNPELVAEKSRQKGITVNVHELLKTDSQIREVQPKLEALRHQRRQLAEAAKGQKPSAAQIQEGQALKEELGPLEDKLQQLQAELRQELKTIPNMPLDEVPLGVSEAENQVIKTVGEPPEFDFMPKSHVDIAAAKDWIDKDRAAKVAGSRFAYLKGDLVLLEFALWQFALSQLTDQKVLQAIIAKNNLRVSDKPFVPVLPPAMALTEVYEATGRLDKEETTYRLAEDNLWLNASAEHTLAPMYLNEIIDEKDLPIRLVGYTTAFRREAGSYGKDIEGILRLHQFNKLEMESFTAPEDGLQEHLYMVAIQEHLMQALKLPYQVIEKCTADIGKPNAKGVDINVWLPGQNKYRETHTADYMTDYQARSLQTRVRTPAGNTQFVHTNDATVFSERPLIAIIENFQQADGSVAIPEVLQPFMGGRTHI